MLGTKIAEKIDELIAAKNYGGAWFWADQLENKQLNYIDFLKRYVWKDNS